jgi:hemolysin activation/secretion protein
VIWMCSGSRHYRWLLPVLTLLMPLLLGQLLLSPRTCRAAEPPKAIFTSINLTHMNYYPEMGITETHVRQEMGRVIAEHGGIVDFSTVQDVASRITSIYRGAGFVFTRAYVPQQRSKNGWVEVRLLEGRLSTVDILDNKRYGQAVLMRPFADLMGKVVYSPDLEEAMAFLNDYPGLNAFGFYSVGEEPGGTRLNVRVQRERDWTGSLHADNYGAELTGRARLLVELEKFNPTDNADHLRVGVLQTAAPQNATYGVFNYDIPVIDKRSQLAFSASTDAFAISRGAGNQQVELTGKTYAARVEYTRQLKRGNMMNHNLHVGLSRDVSESVIKNADVKDVNLEQKNWEADTGFELDHLDRKRGTWYSAGAFIVLGQYDSIDVPGQSNQYTYGHGFAAYNHGIALGESTHQAKLNLDWQYTPDLLPSMSQYSLTGPTRLRGFLPSDFSADTGVIGAATWIFPKWTLIDRKGDMKPDVTMSLFAEYGYGVQNVPTTGLSDNWAYMSDAGAAWLFTLGPDLSATATIATPLTHRINYDPNFSTATRAWIELLWRFH